MPTTHASPDSPHQRRRGDNVLQPSLDSSAPHAILNRTTELTLWRHLRFEIVGALGRSLWRFPPALPKAGPRLLNLGCGVTRIPGWVNADFFHYGLSRVLSKQPRPEWLLDLRYPLRCASDTFDGVYAEHTLEHLYPAEVFNLLCELRRITKPGTWLRVIVPDLGKYVRFYCGELPHPDFQQWATGAEAIRSASQSWGHHSLWDAQLMHRFLHAAGFDALSERCFRQGSDPRLLQDREERRWESLYMEARKPG